MSVDKSNRLKFSFDFNYLQDIFACAASLWSRWTKTGQNLRSRKTGDLSPFHPQHVHNRPTWSLSTGPKSHKQP